LSSACDPKDACDAALQTLQTLIESDQ